MEMVVPLLALSPPQFPSQNASELTNNLYRSTRPNTTSTERWAKPPPLSLKVDTDSSFRGGRVSASDMKIVMLLAHVWVISNTCHKTFTLRPLLA
jgi:hypothetical protein